MQNVNNKLHEIETLLNELKNDVSLANNEPIVGVKFPVPKAGRLSTKTLFFKGDFELGDKVVIRNARPFVGRNYGVDPVGIVVMNGKYATLMAEAEGFVVTDVAEPYSIDYSDDLYEDNLEDDLD